MRRVIRANSLSDVLAFAGPLALFVAALVPGIAFWDTGEMQTVPTMLGIAHPTGFPAFVLLGWLFAHGLPIGSQAARVSLLSACAAAGAAWLVYRFVRDLSREAWPAAAAAVTYAAGDIVWTRAARAEVHDLAVFFTALALTLAARAARNGRAGTAVAAAAAFGCGLATHPVVLLSLPSLVLAAWPFLRRCGRRRWALLATSACAPLVLYLYIPARSVNVAARRLDPAASLGLGGGAFWNYEDPSSPARYWRYLSGSSFHPQDALLAGASPAGAREALAFARTVALTEYGPVMAALAVTGFIYLTIRERRIAAAFGALALTTAAFAPNFRAESDTLRYALPVLWAGGVCAGVGAWWLMGSLVRERSRVASAFTAALLLVALWPNALYAARDVERQRRLDDARGFIAQTVAHTSDGALVIATWTYATPLAYAAFVSHGFGRRLLVSGWPNDFTARYSVWRRLFAHVYFILPAAYATPALAVRRFTTPNWQLAELRR